MTRWTDAQLKAITLSGTNIIVSAGAGSGKTAVLTTRVIEKIKQGININELLVLTFTKEAAREMKERIRSALEKEGLFEQLLLLDASYITTFDSFALSLVKKYHYVLNVNRDISISPDSLITTLLTTEVDKLFESKYVNQDEDFLRLIGDFCVKDDTNIKKVIINLFTKLDQKVDKLGYLYTYFDEVFTDFNIEENAKIYNQIIIDKIKTLQPLFTNLLSEACPDSYEVIYEIMENLNNACDYQEVIEAVRNIELPKKTKACGENYSFYRKDLVEELKKLIEFLRYENEEEIVEEIKKTTIYQKAIINLLSNLEKSISEYKAHNNLYSFYDIAKMAIALVRDKKDIRVSVKNSYHEIMIDEYQDTSDLQEAFISLISNNNVYMVGDIKQSIYRFRNANPSLFKEKYDCFTDELLPNNPGVRIDLRENFRSRKEVINTVNDIFRIIMDDMDYHKRHMMIAGNKHYEEIRDDKLNYELEVLNYGVLDDQFSRGEREAFAIAYDIKVKIDNGILVYDKETRKLRPVTLSDFAILIDRSNDFDTYKLIFEYLSLPLNIFKDESLNAGYDLMILKNMMKFILKIKNQDLDLEFKYLFTSLARSYLYSLPDEAIYTMVMNNKIMTSDVYQTASKIAKLMDSLNTTEFIETIINDFGYLDKIALVGNVDNVYQKIEYLLTLASSLDYFTISDFINHLEEVIESSLDLKYSIKIGDSESIKLMTIHKSKGLEFPICYYAGLANEFNTSDLKEQFLFDNKLGLITPYFENGIKETIYKDIYKYNYKLAEIAERIRLLYVAFTRAKEKIIIVDNFDSDSIVEVSEPKKLKFKSFKKIIDSLFNNLHFIKTDVSNEICIVTDQYKAVKSNDYKVLANSGEVIETLDICKFINNTFNKEILKSYSKGVHKLITKDEYVRMKFGTKIHHILETVDFTSPNLENDIMSLNIEAFFKDKLFSFVNFISKRDLKLAKIYQEYEFISDDKHGIIDLMLEYPDYIDIIDYKLKNIDDEAYITQLKGYEDYIAKKTKKHVNTYLYSIIEGKCQKV